ncbi:unnamed protein product [Diplocarpon coronariae]|uniref:Transcription-repair coupling factor n=1 Tax=Diplocarpon coronariae TaxID=2795749 RepID=A0A218Z1A2_9HELO|nr:transcription-repair coupling factor [Marssonina coronariae]
MKSSLSRSCHRRPANPLGSSFVWYSDEHYGGALFGLGECHVPTHWIPAKASPQPPLQRSFKNAEHSGPLPATDYISLNGTLDCPTRLSWTASTAEAPQRASEVSPSNSVYHRRQTQEPLLAAHPLILD